MQEYKIPSPKLRGPLFAQNFSVDLDFWRRHLLPHLATPLPRDTLSPDLSGTESAILNRESSDSESCDSNRAIPRSLSALTGCDSDGDSESIFRNSTLLRFDSFFASRCRMSGDSRPAIPGIVRFAIHDSVPLRSGSSLFGWQNAMQFRQKTGISVCPSLPDPEIPVKREEESSCLRRFAIRDSVPLSS